MKKLLLALAISSTLPLLAQPNLAASSEKIIEVNQSTISVSGVAKITLPANQVSFSISVSENDPEAKIVIENTRKKMTRLVTLLKNRKNIKGLKTDYVQLNNRNYGDKRNDFYASQSLNFTLTDLSQYDALLTELLNAGANGVNQTQFGNSESEKQQDLLLELALRDAKMKAERMAEAYGQKIGKAISISDNPNVNNSPSPAFYKSFAEADVSGPSIVGGNLELSSRVYVQFELK